MDCRELISGIKDKLPGFVAVSATRNHPDEICVKVSQKDFKDTCLILHKMLPSPIMMLFCVDERKESGKFIIQAVFVNYKRQEWVIVATDVPQENPCFESLAKSIYSSSLFEREIKEMFGVEPTGNPDLRRLRLHNETWGQGNYPLRKDFKSASSGDLGEYKFARVEGEGICEVPVGPVHAGIIAPGHFRFSVAGEPIINLELRLGFIHRGVEKLFEGRPYTEIIRLAESVAGDSGFAHSLAFARAAEKISGAAVPLQAVYLRAIFLELERLYNHVNDIGGIATDVGFTFPAAFASIIKEALLQLNEKLTGSRYLRRVNLVGGVLADIDENKKEVLQESIKKVKRDFTELVKILYSSISFMDRVDTAGVLHKKTAIDLGVVGLAGRSSGIPTDLRKYFPGVYREVQFKMAAEESGDALARLKVRVFEFEESCRMIQEFSSKLIAGRELRADPQVKEGSALGYIEGWRGPVLYWIKSDPAGLIQRCKIVDPSFHNWQALSYAVLGNIIPDFPLCNKSFNLSYPGNDL